MTKNIKDQIFRIYCATSADIMNAGHDVVPSTFVAERVGCSRYMARKLIHELVADGLLENAREGGYDDWNCKIYCINGFRITEKARKTDVYKKEKWELCKLMAECFGGTASSYYL